MLGNLYKCLKLLKCQLRLDNLARYSHCPFVCKLTVAAHYNVLKMIYGLFSLLNSQYNTVMVMSDNL